MSQASQTATRRQSTIRSAGAATHNPEDMSQEVSALLRATDTLQQARSESDQLIRLALDDTELLAMAREIALAQGDTLNEARLNEALDEVKAQRFRFQAPSNDSMATKFATAWVTRADWGPKWRMRVLAAGTTAALVTGSVVGVGEVRQSRWESQLEDSVAAETVLQQTLETDLKRATLDPNAPAAVSSQVSAARGALAASVAELGYLPAAPGTNSLREALYEEDPARARSLLEERESRLVKAQGLQQQAAQGLAKANSLRIAYGEAGRFDQATPAALAGLRDQQRVAFQAAAQRGDAEGMQQAAGTLGEAINLIKIRDAIGAQTGAMSEKSRAVVGERLANATTAIAAGNLGLGQQVLEDTRALLAQASMEYTLRIVSEPNVQTGVWRYYDGNRGAKTYYIVVDAVDANGNKVELPITSVEDKKTTTTSRFAVRVPEEVYNQIASDKTQDGIVDNDVMGNKAAGELEPTYTFPVDGGAITHW